MTTERFLDIATRLATGHFTEDDIRLRRSITINAASSEGSIWLRISEFRRQAICGRHTKTIKREVWLSALTSSAFAQQDAILEGR